jgi:predicted lipid-binding transport protein (Tim44 family)
MNKNSQISLFGRAALFALASTAMLFAQEPAAAPAGSVEPETATEPAAAAPAAEQPAAASAEPAVVATEGGEAKTASIFVQDPAIFHQRQADLEKLKGSLQNVNEGLDSLLADASHIAKMNDQCAAVSINDVMGDECWTFYQVELPAFEEKYMQVTGEVRLGHMETARGLEDRKLQINACVDALYSFAASKDQFLNLKGGVFLEPLAKGFEAH